jgi:hypothetical protein
MGESIFPTVKPLEVPLGERGRIIAGDHAGAKAIRRASESAFLGQVPQTREPCTEVDERKDSLGLTMPDESYEASSNWLARAPFFLDRSTSISARIMSSLGFHSHRQQRSMKRDP